MCSLLLPSSFSSTKCEARPSRGRQRTPNQSFPQPRPSAGNPRMKEKKSRQNNFPSSSSSSSSSSQPKKRFLPSDPSPSLSPSSFSSLSPSDYADVTDDMEPSSPTDSPYLLSSSSFSSLSPSSSSSSSLSFSTSSSLSLSSQAKDAQRRGRKKEMVPITHLLDIHCHPPPSQGEEKKKKKRDVVVGSANGMNTREQFLQANFRFVLKEGTDFSEILVDPDRCPHWDDVEFLFMRTFAASPYCCPICLDPPVVPRISRCGHTFCWTCLMQYAAINEKGRWVRCPICFECILMKDVRGLYVESVTQIRPGDVISMELLTRKKWVSLVSSKCASDLPALTSLPRANEPTAKFSRFMLSSAAFRRWALQRDRRSLDSAIWDAQSEQSESLPFLLEASRMTEMKRDEEAGMEEGCDEVCVWDFFEERGREIGGDGREEGLSVWEKRENEMGTKKEEEEKGREEEKEGGDWEDRGSEVIEFSASAWDADAPLFVPSEELFDPNRLLSDSASPSMPLNPSSTPSPSSLSLSPSLSSPLRPPSLSSSLSPSPVNSSSSTPSPSPSPTPSSSPSFSSSPSLSPSHSSFLSPTPSQSLSSSAFDSDDFYFYQIEDSQQIFLHPLNTRMLQHEFGHWSNFPRLLSNVKVVEISSLQQNEDTRRRYKFLSHLPLSSLFSIAEVDLRSIVSANTHKHFAGDLKRKEMGRRKAAHEACVEREREREREEKERLALLHENEYSYTPEDFLEALPSPSDYPSAFPPALSALSPLSSSPPPLSAKNGNNPPPPSFAQILSKKASVTPTVTQVPKGRKGRQKIFSTVSQRSYK